MAITLIDLAWAELIAEAETLEAQPPHAWN